MNTERARPSPCAKPIMLLVVTRDLKRTYPALVLQKCTWYSRTVRLYNTLAQDTWYMSCTQTFTYDVTLPSPLPGRYPSAPMARGDRYGIVLDPSKRSVPGFDVSGDGGVDPWALAPSHRTAPTVADGWSDG
eukprot:5167637-Prymnesium_polylepis.4